MQNVIEMRVKQLNIRLSDEEAERLENVAKHYGLNAAGVIRFLLKREEDAIRSNALVRSHGPIAGSAAATLEEAVEIVHRAGLAGVTLAVAEDQSDSMQKRYGLAVGDRVVAWDLDLVGLEKALAEMKQTSGQAKSRAKKR